MSKTMRTYRLSDNTLKQIEALQNESGKTATDIIESLVNYVHEEYSIALQGSGDDSLILRQVLGKRIRKVG